MPDFCISPAGPWPIQDTIDACAASGGGVVTLSAGLYETGTIYLRDHVTLHLLKNAVILGNREIDDYPEPANCFIDGVGEKRGRALILGESVTNAAIIGEGMIDGRGREFERDQPYHRIRPFLIRFVNCKNVTIEGVCLRMAAAWCLHLQNSDNVRIDSVSIVNRANENNDGIDVDSSTNVTIQNCCIDSGDDAICLKTTTMCPCRHIRIENCLATSNCAAFKIGTESLSDFSDIAVKNCTFYDVKCGAVKITPVDGGSVDGLLLQNIEIVRSTGPLFFSTGERLRAYYGRSRSAPGQIRNVTLDGVRADAVNSDGRIEEDGTLWGNAKACVVFSGLPDIPIRNVVLRNCSFTMPGGILELPSAVVPQMGKRYPEFHQFGVLPCWGLYLRDVLEIQIKSTVFEKQGSDVRPLCVRQGTVTGDGLQEP